MSLIKSPKIVISLEDSTNIYLKNLENLSFMMRLNEIKGRTTNFTENKPCHRKNVVSFDANSNI
jgi:hypothetical protein